MPSPVTLLAKRRFGPLFATQFLGAMNDNLFRSAMVLLVIFSIYADPAREGAFSAIAGGLFILPFLLFGALAGQLADSRDKAMLTRHIKTAEILVMLGGAAGLILQSVPLLLFTLFLTGTQSAFFGPIKYAVLPQHLEKKEVLGGTGLIEAGTYVAVLLGTILGGLVLVDQADGTQSAGLGAAGVLVTAAIGRWFAGRMPPAPPEPEMAGRRLDWNLFRATWHLLRDVMRQPDLALAIVAISIFWSFALLLGSQFPPLTKNELGADENVAVLFFALFSVGVAAGSVLVNRLTRGDVSARFSAPAAIGIALLLIDLKRRVEAQAVFAGPLRTIEEFLATNQGWWVLVDILGIAILAGIFVVPLYAFLTTRVAPSMTARAIAANNVVNAALMVTASLILASIVGAGIDIAATLWLTAGFCVAGAAAAFALARRG
ncbi:MFS transporter [Sphingomicrobium sp. XHP0239]|uniref:MFS transporter n=1 Tax=Sphingomicrobium maritimum TaxID=3133972 RepID=UPI0031CC5810